MKKNLNRLKGTRGVARWLGACLLVVSLPSAADAQKLVYVVRHAERADGGAAASPSVSGAPADPLLSAAGEARAARLADLLVEAGVKAIFATEFRRTQDTAKPIAAKLGLAVTTVKAGATAVLAATLKSAHPADVVLVVGHSNTVPDIIKALGGPVVTVGDADYDGIFVLVPATGVVSKIKY